MAERRTPDHPIDAFIGLRVRERRVFLQLSIAELAARIGVEPNDLEEYETGERPTSAGELHELSKALGVPVSHFFKGIESKASLSHGDVLADSEVAELVLPTCTDQHPWAQSRMPMDMIFQGRSISLFQASQQWATMSS